MPIGDTETFTYTGSTGGITGITKALQKKIMKSEELDRDIVYIHWVDSNIMHDQTSEVIKPATIQTVGYLIQEKGEYVTVARDLIDEEWRGQISIPRECIMSIRKVKSLELAE